MKSVFFIFLGWLNFSISSWGKEQKALPIREDSDSIHKDIITLKDTVLAGISVTLVVFHNDKGEDVKMIEHSKFPDYSPFKSLLFPRIKDDREVAEGESRYDLKDISIEKRLSILKQAEIENIPTEILRKATVIRHYTRPTALTHNNDAVFFNKQNYRFLQVCSFSEVTNLRLNEPSFCNSYITIYDHNGNIFRQLSINAGGRSILSSDAHFLLCESIIMTPSYEYIFDNAPYLLYDLKYNTVDTIDKQVFYEKDIERNSFSVYGDSYFQIMYISRIYPDQIVHILIEPVQKIVLSKRYTVEDAFTQNNFSTEYKFDSMHLPNGRKINIEIYERSTY